MLYKITFKPQTSFVTELKSSTLFGALCCAIRDIHGTDFLTTSLKEADTGGLITVSDCFFDGYVPVPLHKVYNDEQMLKNVATGDIVPNSFEEFKVEHCIVNRDTNTSNGRWADTEKFTTNNLYVIVSSSLFSKEDIKGLFELMFEKGIGKYKNKGKGNFNMISIEVITTEELTSWVDQTDEVDEVECNGYMVLSDYIPSETESTVGVYSARIINGKTIEGKEKKTVYVINSGSCFVGKTNGSVGRLEYDEETQTYTGGRAIAIPIRI